MKNEIKKTEQEIPKADPVPIVTVAHDESLTGDGTIASLLKLSIEGYKRIDERPDRTVFESPTNPLANTPMDSVTIPLTQLNNNGGRRIEIQDTVVDAYGRMGYVYQLSPLDIPISATVVTYYLPPTSVTLQWGNIVGDIMDNQFLASFLGDRKVFKDYGNTFVNAINRLYSLLGDQGV